MNKLTRKLTQKKKKGPEDTSDEFVFETAENLKPKSCRSLPPKAKFEDIYKFPLPLPNEETINRPYEYAPSPPQPKINKSPFHSPQITSNSTINSNRNNNSYRPAPPARHHVSSQVPLGHRRSKSDANRLPALMLPLNINYADKAATIASPTPRNTPADFPSRPSALKILSPSRSDDNLPTPGWGEAPLSFHQRLNEKSSSLQGNTKSQNHHDGTSFPVPDELERFLYGNAALNLEKSDSKVFEAANESAQSLTDWEEMKNQLKKDHQVITRRVSNRKRSENSDPSRLDGSEHFYFKPHYSRKDAESALQGCPEGSFLVRKSKQEGALALSVMTNRLGCQHLLLTCQQARWMLSGEKNVVREFRSVPELISFYKTEPLPVKGTTPFLLR